MAWSIGRARILQTHFTEKSHFLNTIVKRDWACTMTNGRFCHFDICIFSFSFEIMWQFFPLRCTVCCKSFKNWSSLQDHCELLSHWSEEDSDEDSGDDFDSDEYLFSSSDDEWIISWAIMAKLIVSWNAHVIHPLQASIPTLSRINTYTQNIRYK